jgi:hypothetical protein
MNEEFCHLGYYPCSALKVIRRFGGTCRLSRQHERISQARNNIQRTARCYIAEDITLHNHRSENLKS